MMVSDSNNSRKYGFTSEEGRPGTLIVSSCEQNHPDVRIGPRG
jgi:hypothetical protein